MEHKLEVPDDMRCIFIIVADNPSELLVRSALPSRENRRKNGNFVRVRCNSSNLGASASRNRGIDDSSAEFILNLDDDLIPETNLLHSTPLLEIDETVVGLIGLVHFPLSPTLPLKHEADPYQRWALMILSGGPWAQILIGNQYYFRPSSSELFADKRLQSHFNSSSKHRLTYSSFSGRTLSRYGGPSLVRMKFREPEREEPFLVCCRM